ncbi:hypothetical protein [Symbioplanes lichenis]|uniref:hypothetical protein n=1 Tax=Symbioplanes lichenis TaxID=1629072 RepID=UPI0027388EAE|nr:hypothetical protein [Actinoplanes lichenis]
MVRIGPPPAVGMPGMCREAGIRVNAVAPDATRATMVGDPKAVRLTAGAGRRRTMGGMAGADTVAAAITGVVLPVDGDSSAV